VRFRVWTYQSSLAWNNVAADNLYTQQAFCAQLLGSIIGKIIYKSIKFPLLVVTNPQTALKFAWNKAVIFKIPMAFDCIFNGLLV